MSLTMGYSLTWQKSLLYLKGSLHDLQDIGWVFLQQTNLSNGEIFFEHLKRSTNMKNKSQSKQDNFEEKQNYKVHQPHSKCRSGWWQQKWEWCYVCPAGGPVWVWKGNLDLYPLCICPSGPGGSARHCAPGCRTARWRRQPRSGRPTRWRKPADVCCGCANRSYPERRIPLQL